jgi:hypothetical protein
MNKETTTKKIPPENNSGYKIATGAIRTDKKFSKKMKVLG